MDDIPTPKGTLHLAFGLSSIAAGRITAINLDAVRAAPGVVGVWEAKDLPSDCDCSPSAHDEPMLSGATIQYLGQPIFLVAATSHLAARKAARLGQISYAERDAILTIDEALAADSRFEDGPRIWEKGDAGEAIDTAPRQISGVIEMGGQEHFYLEGQSAMALPQEGGDMVVHASTQHPTEIQHKVAHALHLPMHAVRVETRRMGGGFGGKESQGNALAIACAVVAAATGRPAKMRYDRDDDFMITGKRHDFRIEYRVGFDDEGVISGVEFEQYTRCGWAQDLSLPVADRAMLHADNAYHLPHVRIESHRLKTNTQSATAFRGFGGPQGMLGIERVMDHIAHDLGLDPVAVRRANYYSAEVEGGQPPAPSAPPRSLSSKMKEQDIASRGSEELVENTGAEGVVAGQTTPYGQVVEDFILHDMTDRLLEGADYEARRAAVAEWNAGNAVIKKGIGFSPVKFRDFLHADPSQSGRRARACVSGRLHPHEPRWHRDGTGPVPESGAGGCRPVWRAAGDGEDHGDGHGQGAQHLGHGGILGVGSERDGGQGGL